MMLERMAYDISHGLMHGMTGAKAYWKAIDLILTKPEFLLAVTAIVLMETVEWAHEHYSMQKIMEQCPGWLRWLSYYALCTAILVFGVFGHNQFIYFQF